MSQCPCTRPTTGWLCPQCLTEFRTHVRRIPATLADLAVTARRQDVHGGNGGGRTTGSKPPINLTAMTLHLDIEVMLRSLYGHASGTAKAPDHVMTKFITIPRMFSRLAAKPCIIEYAHQLPRLLDQATQLIDTPANTVHIGTCPNKFCGTELTAREEEKETTCSTCGHTYPITAYRTARIMAALGYDDTPIRASEAVRRLNKSGCKITPQNLKDWQRRGRLHPISTDEHQRRLYNIKDIYTLYTERASA